MDQSAGIKNKWVLFCIEILFFSLGLLYIYFTPLWIPADEERHFAYCEHIAQHHTLPVFRPNFDETSVYMAFHPPLYYLLGALCCKNDGKLLEEEIVVNDGPGPITIFHPKEEITAFSGKARSAYILRFFSLLLGGLTIYFVYKTASIIFPGKTSLIAALTLFVAMNPEFMHVSASISNENLSTTLSTACLLSLLCYLHEPRSTLRAIILGILLGCSLITKITCLFLVPLLFCVVLYLLVRGPQITLKHFFIILFLAAGIGGWWYVRNWILFNDPFFSKTIVEAQSWGIRHAPPSLHEISIIIEKTFISFFGYFGGLKVAIPSSYLSFYGGIVLLGIAGLVRFIITKTIKKNEALSLAVLFLALLGGISIFVIFNIKYIGTYSGRYLFVVISPIAIFIFIGLQTLLPIRFRSGIFNLISLVLILLNFCSLFFVLKPGYAEPRLVAGVKQELFDYPSPEININNSAGQSFISPMNNLCGIEVVFAGEKIRRDGMLQFILIDEDGGQKTMRTIKFQVNDIENFSKYYFVFPPIKNSMGKKYVFNLLTQDMPAGKGVALWHTRDDTYSGGEMLINLKAAGGDLYFIAYYFTGDEPATDWEGTRELAIYQGLYFDVWEYQLYQERSRDFRETTHSHKKILQQENCEVIDKPAN